jgi:hypothetical protein
MRVRPAKSDVLNRSEIGEEPLMFCLIFHCFFSDNKCKQKCSVSKKRDENCNFLATDAGKCPENL